MNLKYTQSDFYHNSRLNDFRFPQGAVPSGTQVRIRARVSSSLCKASVFIESSNEFSNDLTLMKCVESNETQCIFEGYINIDQSYTGLVRYSFMINDRSSICFYSGSSAEGKLALSESSLKYQITVYEEDFKTPDWVKDAVFYHIFVDSFNKSGERGGLDRLDYHISRGRKIVKHENWNEQPNYLPDEGAQYYDPNDFYGGDLEGIREKLPYLKELGVNAIYLSPIFESPSNHKYNTSDYMKVDPSFGSNEDFVKLASDAKALGMHIMLDGVFSHTGDDSIYFDRYGNYQNSGAYSNTNSPYFKWYEFKSYPNDFESWWGFQTLPNVNEMEPSYLDFIARNDDSVIKHWLRLGASAWRLDVADELPDEFILELRKACKAVGEKNMLLGEVWEDASNKFAYGKLRKYVFGNELDSVMNYPFRDALLHFLMQKTSGFDFVNSLEILRENYPDEFYSVLLNLVSSHDVPRALSLLGGGPDKDSGWTREMQAGFSLNPDARNIALKRLKLASAIQMSLPGAPCIYYGDEVGVEGLMDPFNRTTYPWGNEDGDLLSHYKKWTKLRNDNRVMRTGKTLLFSPSSGVVVILRFFENHIEDVGVSCALIIINRDETDTAFDLDIFANAEGVDSGFWARKNAVFTSAFSSEQIQLNNGVISMSAPKLSASIFFAK